VEAQDGSILADDENEENTAAEHNEQQEDDGKLLSPRSQAKRGKGKGKGKSSSSSFKRGNLSPRSANNEESASSRKREAEKMREKLSIAKKTLREATAFSAAESQSDAGSASARRRARQTVDLGRMGKNWSVAESAVRELVRAARKLARRKQSKDLELAVRLFQVHVKSLVLVARVAAEEQSPESVDALTAKTVEVADALGELGNMLDDVLLAKGMGAAKVGGLVSGARLRIQDANGSDVLQLAKQVADDLKNIPAMHKRLDAKSLRRAINQRQIRALLLAEMSQNFARRLRGIDDQRKLVDDLAAAVRSAAGRLFALEASLLNKETANDDQVNKLTSSATVFSQLVGQLVFHVVHALELSQKRAAALRQKVAPVWAEIALKDASNLREATLNQLVLQVTDLQSKSLKFQKVFITTYRMLCSAATLFNKLLERYDVPQDREHEAALVQPGVCIALRLWLDSAPSDFSAAIITRLTDFLQQLRDEGDEEQSDMLLRHVRIMVARVQTQGIDSSDAVAQLPHGVTGNMYLNRIEEQELARQLTVVDWASWSSIQSVELLSAAWSRDALKHRSPNVLDMIQRYNTVQNWVVSSIIGRESLGARAAAMARFITVGMHLFAARNYSTLLAVVSGLGHPAVKRLKFTTNAVDADLRSEWRQITTQTSSANNYSALRQLLKHANPPTLPPLGMYLTDLIMIEDRNDDYTDRGLINFQKCELVYDVIVDVKEYQAGSFHYSADSLVPVALTNLDIIDPEQFFNVSTEREPRNATLQDLVP
jgi:RasGEF domain/RasGEF N-terminal motif